MPTNYDDLKEFELKHYPKVEFLALKPEIDALMSQGYSAKGIFRKLRKEKNIMMSYTSLTRYIRKYCKNLEHNQQEQVIKAQVNSLHRQTPVLNPPVPTGQTPNTLKFSSQPANDLIDEDSE